MNTQNLEVLIRACVEPREGNVYVQADFDQIELRLMAGLAGVSAYLDAFNSGADPHAVTAMLIYGHTFRKAVEEHKLKPRKSDLFTILRRFAKTFVYAVLYGGTATTVHENISKATDEAGNLLFPDMTFREVEASVNAWMRNAKEVPAWWDRQWAAAEQLGYAEEPILGRRRHMPVFLRNEAINHPIQGAAAVIMGQALLRLRRSFTPNYSMGWGIVNQMHDAVTVEVPEHRVREACEIVTEAMCTRYPNIPVDITAKGVATSNFAEEPYWFPEPPTPIQ
jgi:DNA polymerase-1